MKEWQALEHQGRAARAVGSGLVAHCREVRRLATLVRAPDMVMFLLFALCEWLPTRDAIVIQPQRMRKGRVSGAPSRRLTALAMPLAALLAGMRQSDAGAMCSA